MQLSISQELAHHTAWTASCNLKLNPNQDLWNSVLKERSKTASY